MADILRFPQKQPTTSAANRDSAMGAVIADAVEAVITDARSKELSIRLGLEEDIAVMNTHVGFGDVFVDVLRQSVKRAPAGTAIDISGSRSLRGIEIEVVDAAESNDIRKNNALQRGYEAGGVVVQRLRVPQGGNATIVRICEEADACVATRPFVAKHRRVQRRAA